MKLIYTGIINLEIVHLYINLVFKDYMWVNYSKLILRNIVQKGMCLLRSCSLNVDFDEIHEYR